MSRKKRILSGMRPTGKLHLGNYVGALENWVKLQGEYDNFHLIADYHVLTTQTDTSQILENTLEMVADWIACGIDPDQSPVFRQSQIKEHAELHLLFSMLVTTARLERNPTLKEQAKDLNMDSLIYGHLGYPVLQSADILLYKGEVVPVGEDQAPHVEITREIARKFNTLYGEVFPIPQTKLAVIPRLPGLDGAKMSKSLNNTILVADSPDEVQQKVMRAITDPQKIRRNDPGHPEVCNVFTYHKQFNAQEVPQIEADCKSGVLGCVDCKKNCAKKISDTFAPYADKRNHLINHKSELLDIIADGEKRAGKVARETMEAVREVMKLG
ncbi:MAG: tryptophan--tRNA ligase [Candidatus Marinimicrobia bacterium]|nr:tryptophan--tRNA ligase [Candidatus Neomarinimicrobiota bacterium]